MDAALPARVEEIEPGTVHRRPRRSRHVRLRPLDSGPLVVYDPRTVVTPDAVGTDREVELSAVVPSVESCPADERGIEPGPDGETVTLTGVAVGFETDGTEGLLDVGAGTIRFDTAAVDRRLAVGDRLCLADPVVHVTGMSPAGQSMEGYLAQLDGADPAARREAAMHLGHRASERAVDRLVARFRDEGEADVRRAVVTALGRLAVTARRPDERPDPRIRSTLEAATGDESGTVRDAADEWLDRVAAYWFP
ncbi:HEAT repeat domain-containing protein [Halorientalis halophila]|uniref:HEAT repeat domain-containing protein n=1 Tax=Halorientalis halophila TaxID=3108499 RepID=UPI003009A762